MSDYVNALLAFQYTGGAVRLTDKIEDPLILRREWGAAGKDEYTIPFGPWSHNHDYSYDGDDKPQPSAATWVWRYGTASAGTGSRYAVLVTRVHPDVASREGGPLIITVLSPWQDAYAVAEGAYMVPSYVAEKLTNGRHHNRNLHAGDLAALTKLIGILLDRETT